MPKSSFDFDDFKRFYSNEDESKSIPYFWQKFDSENYSIWLSEYKYNHELTKVCKHSHLIILRIDCYIFNNHLLVYVGFHVL